MTTWLPVDVDPVQVCDRPGCGRLWPESRNLLDWYDRGRKRRPGAKRGVRCYCCPDCADQDTP